MTNGLSNEAKNSIDRGLSWLLKQQHNKTGGWHPETYGAMRGGASATSLALYTASHLPKLQRDKPEWKSAIRFLLRGLTKRECIACPDGTLDYPTYSTALTLIATRRIGAKLPEQNRKQLTTYLISSQLTDANGFPPDHIEHGGWDLLGGSGAEGFTSGTNISVSFFAVKALSGEKHPERSPTIQRAVAWVKRCQNFSQDDPSLDGGFFFHPKRAMLGNKAQWKKKDLSQPRSYGSPTCDGLGLMTAAGMNPKDKRVSSAIGWLDSQTSVRKVPGFKDAPKESGWDDGLKFYYLMGLSRSIAFLDKESATKRRTSMVKELVDIQEDDGSWQNKSDRMREDDPHIATCFSLIALSNVVGAIGK